MFNGKYLEITTFSNSCAMRFRKYKINIALISEALNLAQRFLHKQINLTQKKSALFRECERDIKLMKYPLVCSWIIGVR